MTKTDSTAKSKPRSTTPMTFVNPVKISVPIAALLLLLTATGCGALKRDYHTWALSESLRSSTYQYHLAEARGEDSSSFVSNSPSSSNACRSHLPCGNTNFAHGGVQVVCRKSCL